MERKELSAEDQRAIKRIEYVVAGGRVLIEGIQERHFVLAVDFERAVVELRQHGPLSDEAPGEIGFFRTPLESKDADKLRQAIDSAPLDALPQPRGGGIGTSLISLTLARASGVVQARFPSRDMETLERLNPLLNKLDPLVTKARRVPLQAVKLEIGAEPDLDGRFRLALRNVGTLPLLIVPPRTSNELTPTGVRIGALAPGEDERTAEPKWQIVPIEATSDAQSKLVKLTPGASIDFMTQPWKRQAAVRYMMQGQFATYEGPAASQGLPVIRGRLFSELKSFYHR